MRVSILYLIIFIQVFNSIAQTIVGHPDYFIYSCECINSNQVFYIEEGPRGLIYVASVPGIQEYDGENWEIIDTGEPGVIHSFKIDQNTGIIYFGKPGELAYLRPNQYGCWEYHSINKQLDQNLGKFSDVWNVRLINNNVYFQTNKKLFRYNIDTKQIKIWESNTFFSSPGIINNQFYVGQKGKGLYSIVNDSLILLSDHEKLKGMLFYNIIPFNNTHILITSTNEAVLINNTTYEPDNNMDKLLNKLKPVLQNRIYNISNLQNNKFAIATYYNGIYILDSLLNIQTIYNKEDGLPTNLSWYTTQSKNGIIWGALDNGVVKIESEEYFISFNKNKSLNNRVESLLKHEKLLYLGTNEGLYKLNIANIDRIYLEETNIKAPVWNIIKFRNLNKDTTILIASIDGVWEQEDGTFKLILKQETVGDILVSKVYPNRLYYSFNGGVSYIENKDGKWSYPVNVSDIEKGVKLIEDSFGNLWVYTGMQNVYLISNDGLEDNNLQTQEIFVDSSGISIFDGFLLRDTLILITSKGFYSFNKDRNCFLPDSILFNFNDKDLLPGLVHKVSDDEFWIVAYNKQVSYLFHFYRENNSFKKDEREIPFFKYTGISQIYFESDDRLWLGLEGKLLLIKNLNKYKEDTSNVNVLIRRVSINNDSVIFYGTNYIKKEDGFVMNLQGVTNADKPIHYDLNNISFEFASPYFDKECLNQYSFMLEGYDKDWSEWSIESKKEYTNLREGNYTFKVKARNIYDKESKPYFYSFTINPPYYRSLSAYTIYVLCFMFSTGFAIWHFRNKHKREKDKLESIITQRTLEIVAQKEEIERQAKLLMNTNQQLNKLSIVASKVDNPVIICNANGKIEWINDSYCKYFNKDPKKIIKSNYNLSDICFNRNIGKYFDTCVKEKRPITYTVNTSEVRTNRELWMQTTLTPVLNHTNEVINIIAISSDITYLHELNNTRDMVISVITHDLKSPLLAFKMITKNLLNRIQGISQNKLENNLTELYSHSSEIYEFLQYLSEWLKSQKGSLSFFPHAFDISKTLIEVLNLLKISACHKKITLLNQIPDSTKVFADENMIKTVFRNLISNAIKFSTAGDTVTVFSEKERDKTIITVSDNGIGIDPDKKEKIFKHNENKGLGLLICEEFIKKNKGKIWFEDKEKGALIKFMIPNC